VIEVVSGPGVSRYGSRAECAMAAARRSDEDGRRAEMYHRFKPVV